MKRVIFSITMMMLMATFTQAQIDIKPSFGLNNSHLTTEHVDWRTEGRLGYQFGVGVLVGNKFYIEPGVYWQTSSLNLINEDNAGNEEEFKNTLSTIRVPVYVGYHLLGSEETFADLRIFAGPAASFVTGVNSDSDDITKDDFKSMMFDVDVGAAVDVWFLFLEWHYVFGLTPYFSQGSDAKMQSFVGSIGVRIRL